MTSIVVGMDGSSGAAAALGWAEVLVDSSGVVHAVHVVPSQDDVDEALQELRDTWANSSHPVEHHVVVGDRASSLLAFADDIEADVILVGLHDRAKLEPRVLGRLSSSVIRQTHRPLGVVPPGSVSALSETSTLLVGFGHGRPAAAALAWAAELAAARSAKLSLFTAIPRRPVFKPNRLLDVLAFYIDPELIRTWAIEDLQRCAEQVQSSTPEDLEISISAIFGSAGHGLVGKGATADIVVLNLDREEHTLGHTVPGSVHYAITHAPCPVFLIPDEAGVSCDPG